MIYSFQNCKNILSGSITVEYQKLNIRYGANGTGKTSLSLGIQSLVKEELREKLIPYVNAELVPMVTVDTSIPRSIKVFDEEYIDTYLFKETDVLDGERVYEVLIKDEDLEQKKGELLKLFDDLSLEVSKKDISVLLSKLDEMRKSIQLNSDSSKIKGTSKAFKALKQGNHFVRENIPNLLKNYISLLISSDKIRWIDWFSKGHDFSDQCPYCRKDLPENFEEIKSAISSRYKKSDVQNATQFLEGLPTNLDCLNEENKKLAVEKFSNADDLDSADTEVVDILQKLYKLDEIIYDLRSISAFYLLNEENTEFLLQSFLEIKTEVISIVNESTQKYLETIASCILKIQAKRTDYLKQKGIFNSRLEVRVRESQKQINEFMETAGIPYEVEIINQNTRNPRMILKHISHNQVNKILDGLSYGEKNAFALMMFVMDVTNDEPELIILDDPISSFDENKKYAILHSMFIKKQRNTLKNKTVLMLTHDFTPIIDLVRVKGYDFVDARYIKTVDGILDECTITKNDIKSVIEVAKETFSDTHRTEVSRIINYRRFLELTNDMGDLKYDMISSLLHLKPIPQKKWLNTNLESFTEIEKTSATRRIKEMLADFDYDRIVAFLRKKENLISAYDLATNYEKINITRILNCLNNQGLDNKVLQKFIDESYHIENTMTFQLDPNSFDNIPSYIMAACDAYVEKQR